MTAVEAQVPAPATTSDAGDIVHIRCCAAPVALCGLALDEPPAEHPDELVCVVCDTEEMRGEPCPNYGRCIEDEAVLS